MNDVSKAHAQERDYGRLECGDDRLQLRFTRRFRQRPDTVWRALTEPEHLAAWFPHDIEGERAAGARLRFVSRENEAPPFDGEMLLFDPPSVMELRWGDDVLRFELRPDGDGTVLHFTDTFDELGKAARDGAGWHACLDLLVYQVDGHTAPWSSADRWGQVHGSYVERLGAEASAIGPPEEWERVHGAGKDASR
jgi:uncharacterized protein YndB with AHSA1/START domain